MYVKSIMFVRIMIQCIQQHILYYYHFFQFCSKFRTISLSCILIIKFFCQQINLIVFKYNKIEIKNIKNIKFSIFIIKFYYYILLLLFILLLKFKRISLFFFIKLCYT